MNVKEKDREQGEREREMAGEKRGNSTKISGSQPSNYLNSAF